MMTMGPWQPLEVGLRPSHILISSNTISGGLPSRQKAVAKSANSKAQMRTVSTCDH